MITLLLILTMALVLLSMVGSAVYVSVLILTVISLFSEGNKEAFWWGVVVLVGAIIPLLTGSYVLVELFNVN